MIEKYSRIPLAMASAAILTAFGGQAVAETTLNAVSSLQSTNTLTKSWLTNYMKVLNASNSSVKIKYLGGQEIVPPRKAAGALKRGVFDILNSPTAYYIGTVPEGYAILASNQGPKVFRKNGAWELLQEIYAKKAGGHLLSWGNSMTSYNMYLLGEPKLDSDGVPNLKGVKMRATGTYRPLFRALGASTINIKSSELFTALQRGTVAGFGWPDVAIVQLGVHKIVKYRIIPNFYQTNTVTTVNLASWSKLTKSQQDAMTKLAISYETASVHWMEKERLAEEKVMKAAGVKDIILKPSAASKYLDIAHGEIWKELKNRSEHADKLRKLMYFPGKANRQATLGGLKLRD
jgi:TRAP-type C4-dicarboxylate transport system substrate-binding protein